MKKNICFVTSHYGVTKNGPGTFADNFIRLCMKDDRFNLTVISSDTDTPQYGEKLYHVKKSRVFGSTLSTAFKLNRIIRKLNKSENFDKVFFNTFRLGLFSTGISIPIYNNINDYYFAVKQKSKSFKRFIYNKFWTYFYFKIISSADVNFVNSLFTQEQILQSFPFSREKFLITYKGIDTDKFTYKYNEITDKVNFLFVGSDFNRKGLDIVIETVKKVDDDDMLGKLYIIGEDKKTEDHYKKLISRLNLESKIELLGKLGRDDIIKYHNLSHIYMLPSRREALGVSIIEAAASGTTVIASKCGGIPEIIEHSKEGYIIDAPTPENMFEAVKNLIENKTLRKEFSETARDKISMFSFNNVYNKIAEVLYE